ncbi:adhesion G protein-coupled receptor L2-like [Mercenaria mercenaria]|uniref:adhesion G protein-coupled receptor L2-like n=1 Tax=Mercenaria mercenaria TaxID=6596 RepID=UPI00234F6AC6|nr:adhesion G protein-coupled receptor L2-like [Mercenaria mercenaria]
MMSLTRKKSSGSYFIFLFLHCQIVSAHKPRSTLAEARVRPKLLDSCMNVTNYTPPRCIDHPTGYGCDCGPGFHWNTVICMSTAIDSRLEFSQQSPVRYTLLMGKAFPSLSELTVAFWIKVPDSSQEGTIMSYKHDAYGQVFIMSSSPALTFRIWNQKIETGLAFSPNKWWHIAFAWTSKDGSWVLYLNGEKKMSAPGSRSKQIPFGGEFVLGQAPRGEKDFNLEKAFVGDLTHLHIWSFLLTQGEIYHIRHSCGLMYCGDAVQWTEFRRGTRGAMRMRWPSGVLPTGKCFTEDEMGESCNRHCSDTIGAQCNEQIVENIRWTRTPAKNTISVQCPKDVLSKEKEVNTTAIGTRPCFVTAENEGEWGKANIDNCISPDLRKLKYKFQKHLLADYIDERLLLDLGHGLVIHTKSNAYGNPVDVATVIDLLAMLVNTQANVIVLQVQQWTDGNQTYARALGRFPTVEETKEFIEIVADVVDNLLSEKHGYGWNATQPPGTEGDNLMKVLETFAHVMSRSLQNHMIDGNIGGNVQFEEANLKTVRPKIEISAQAQWIQKFKGSKFPSSKDRASGIQSNYGEVEMPSTILSAVNDSDLPSFVKTAGLRVLGMTAMLPNHDLRATGKKAKEDNLNTPIIAMFLHTGSLDISSNLSTPVEFTLPYLNTFNISNPECVRLEHGTTFGGKITEWRWTRNGCELKEDRGDEGVCACSVTGIFAITTDMYNDNWNKGEVRPILMNFASYIGCCASATFCLTTCLLHIYYKTSSSTASLHKNLGMSVVFGQLVFMIGIDQYENTIVCQIFAVCLHYFFLANFSWLMNEAFNLYIVITYSSHAHDGNNEGSLVRYYILGWIIPAVLVGAFVGSQGQHYYAKDMCWISWGNLWLFVGPALGIIAVSIMVLIFTAKEHNENSYTKSEKSNKSIILLMKALWTQIILITVVWSFAFISLRMSDRIVKYIFGLFNCLQGSFFFVFYLLLNEEVRNIFKSKKKKRTLTAHGFDEIDDRSVDSNASTHLVEKDRLETLALDPRPRRRRDHKRRQRKKSQKNHEEEDERIASDCEMITSV